jgi:peptide deformylase
VTRPILTVPDAALRAVCAQVTVFDAALADLSEEMFAAMYAAPGRGLAAPQIGVLQRIFVMDVTWKTGTRTPRVFVNPHIVTANVALVVNDESCLSIPMLTVAVPRPRDLVLQWQDLDGAAHEEAFEGTDAVIVQHERDHLDGILCTDYTEIM